MEIVIVGAGLGGLAAAFCFAKDGHHVQVFEQRADLSPQGSGLIIRPGASRILKSWGLGAAIESVADITSPFVIRDLQSGKPKTTKIPSTPSKCPEWGIPRPALQDIFYRHAVEAGCRVVFNVRVKDVVDTSRKPCVHLDDGRTVTADLVIVADGIRSRMRARVLSDLMGQAQMEPILSDSVFYGVVVPQQHMESDRDARCLLQQSEPTVWVDNERYVVGRRPTKFPFWSGLFGLRASDVGIGRMWDEEGDLALVRECFKGSCPEITAVLKLATSCDRWRIAEMPDLPRWTSHQGAVILIGDAAHAMHPNAAQGISQTIEDIGALSTLLTSVENLSIADVTKLWQDIRKPRADRIKAYATWNTSMFLGKQNALGGRPEQVSHSTSRDWMSMGDVTPDCAASFKSPAFYKWAHDYDTVAYVHQHLEKYRKTRSLL